MWLRTMCSGMQNQTIIQVESKIFIQIVNKTGKGNVGKEACRFT